MSYVVPAQLGAQVLSLFVFSTMAAWYAVPRLKARERADALIPLLWVHVFRFVALRFRARIGIWLAWLLVAEFAYDTVTNVQAGMQEHLFGQARGISWLVVGDYVPLLIVTTGLLAWQLYTRRDEELSASARPQAHAAANGRLTARGQG